MSRRSRRPRRPQTPTQQKLATGRLVVTWMQGRLERPRVKTQPATERAINYARKNCDDGPCRCKNKGKSEG